MTPKRANNLPDHVASPDHPQEMLSAEAHARQHAHVRKAHETELMEDYVELIADLIEAKGEARAVELSQRMGVTQATVGKMLQRLIEHELVAREPYRALFLTEAGRTMAQTSRVRHQVVLRFLRAIGVPEDIARQDAEGIEHHVSDETLAVMQHYIGERGL